MAGCINSTNNILHRMNLQTDVGRLKVTNVWGNEAEPICTYYRCKHRFSEHGTNRCRCKHPQNTIIGVNGLSEA